MLGFNDIIGHEEIIRHLKNAIQTEKVSHSYIFTGDPGSGKKLLAGTYAMTLQCEEGLADIVIPARRQSVRITRISLW